MGYSNVGVVLKVGSNVHDLNVGDRVVSNGPHAEVVSVPRNLVCPIPANVDDEDASFTVVSSIGLQSIRLVQPSFGETVVVVGLGLIGLITCQLLKANGCRVIGFDYDSSKVDKATSFGVDAFSSHQDFDTVNAVMNETNHIGADAVIITASTPCNKVISNAAKMSRQRGRIVLVGVVGLNLSRADFYEKELSFQVSCSYGPGRYDKSYEQHGQDYPMAFVRWTENRNFQAVLNAMSSGSLNVKELVSLRVSINTVNKIYEDIHKHKSKLGIVIEYGDSPDLSKKVLISKSKKNEVEANLAVVGAGNFSQAMILPCLVRHGAKIKAIVSSKGITGNHAARKFGISESVCNYEEVLGDKSIDSVVITTPHNLHASMCIKALEANKHVFVEKPLALTQDELDQITEVYNKHNDLHLVVGFNRRFSPLILKIKELLKDVVEPMNLAFTVNAGFIPKDHWTQDKRVGGGRILGEACHFIDLMSFVSSSRIVSVSANALGKDYNIMSDNVVIILNFENGSQATINYFSNGSKAYSKERMEVFSQGRVLVLNNFRRLEGFGFKGFRKMKLSRQDKGHNEQFRLFVKSLECGGSSIISFNEIINSTQATLAVIESIDQNGVPVEIF